MALTVGDRLGRYDVTALLGEGGMGQVWQATDTQLGRDVALKILPDAFAADPDRLARFQREAQVLASLNHPGIAAIYGIEEAEGRRALVLELVEGPTLADRIAQGPIPVDEALPIAKQIADALEAAHEQGIIHRDLKPANVKVKDDGTVKVLDFGLAKALDRTPASDPSQPPTLTVAATQIGVIMGTAAYMSPEQARGKAIDRRADIWSFGVVLYEMLTGTRAFGGDDVSVTLARVLERDPNVETLPAALPPALHVFLRRCLEKDPRQRVQAIGDMRLAMEGAFETSGRAAATVDERVQRSGVRPGLVGLVGLALAVAAGVGGWVLKPQRPQPVSRLVVSASPSRPVVPTLNSRDVAISPDGTHVIYQTAAGDGQFDVRALDQMESVPLRGPEGAVEPFMSPDGAWVGFQAGAGGPLQRVSIRGGPPVTICLLAANLRGASWGPDDTIVFGVSTTSTLFRVPAAGGEPEAITAPDGRYHVYPDVLPLGQGVLFTVSDTTTGSQDDQIALLDLDTGQHRVIIENGSSPRYVPTGHVVYAVGGTLQAVAFDLDRLEVSGSPVPVVEGVAAKPSGAASFALSDTGALAYVSGPTAVGRRTFVWVDRAGHEEPLPLPARVYASPRLSPDGTRIAVVVADETNDLWVYDATSAAGQRLSPPGGGTATTPVWTPDGTRVVFSRLDDSGTRNIYVVPADGSGMPERLTNSEDNDYPTSATPDGGTVMFTRVVGGLATPHREIWEVSLDGARTATPLLQGEFARGNAEYSPDGDWVVYRSDQSGGMEVYAQPYPGPGPVVPLSVGGGDAVTWSPDGTQLFYRLENRMMAVDVQTSGSLRTGPPVQLFEGPYFATPGAVRQYHVASDGRFLMLKGLQANEDDTPTQVVLVQNWFEELRARVPLP